MSAPEPIISVRPVSELAARRVEWLWPSRLALGKLAILEGDPGLGKSLVTLDLCARLSTGRPWPDGTPSPGPWPSLVFEGEDNNRDTLGPRLQAFGADLARVFYPDGDDPLTTQPLGLPSGAAALDAAIVRTGARLVVLDPLAEFLDRRVCTNNEASVRRALKPLARIAEARGCVFLLVRHLNKVEGRRALYRGGGSIALVAACRSAWLVAADPDAAADPSDPSPPARRVLASVKNNLAPPQPSLAFELGREEGAAMALTWVGPVAVTADALLARPRRVPATPPRDVARAFLKEVLAGGPLTSQDVWQRVREEGLSVSTVRRAKKELGVFSRWLKVDGGVVSYWLLPGQNLPAEVKPQTLQDAMDVELKRLLKTDLPHNPLDEDD
ncbi:MAG TPA: AAA family ATPase [Gemmataceae bacterium]|nr:AAA family ATPase [Gemmataceae bacterium]